jgi:hypothetical protein
MDTELDGKVVDLPDKRAGSDREAAPITCPSRFHLLGLRKERTDEQWTSTGND